MIAYEARRMRRAMRTGSKRLLAIAGFGLATILAACQGNLGSGSGLAIPQQQPYGQPGGPGGAGAPSSQSRQRMLDGAVYLTKDAVEIPLPTLNGYGVTLALGTPTPTPSPTPLATAMPNATSSPSVKSRRKKSRAQETHVAITSPTSSPTPSTIPSPPTSSAPVVVVSPSVTASEASSASPSPAPKFVTKTIVFPDDAPPVPTPQASGNVQTFNVRKAIVRGYLQPGAPISLYGLGAVRFMIPKAEQSAGRGYTIAVFTVGRRHHDALVTVDSSPVLEKDIVASTRSIDPVVLKKGTGYLFMLYGDELLAPAVAPSGYPAPGQNPFVTPYPSGVPGAGSQSGVGVGVGTRVSPLPSIAQPIPSPS